MGLLIPCAAAAAQGPQLTVSSQEAAANQTVGLTALPADCQSLQITLTLSADAGYTFTADSALADRSGVYTTYKQYGQNVTIYVTAKTGTLPDFPFDDVAWASANGVVSGYTDGSFRPNDTITREQMAAILYQYARLQGKLDSGRADLSIFADVDDLSAYAKEPMSWAVAQGLFSGVSADMLAPGGSTTRAQAAVILTAFSKAMD